MIRERHRVHRFTFLAFVLFVGLTAMPARATDIAAGVLSGDATWTKANSPYVLSGDVQVGGTLTIAPGTVVESAPSTGARLTIYGNLNAGGTSTEPVIFRNIQIRGGITTKQSPFRMSVQYTRIEGGGIYEPTGNTTYGSLSLTDSWINPSPGSYLYLWYPVANCNIERNTFVGSKLSVGIDGPTVAIKNNLFQGTKLENWASYSGSMLVSQNTFSGGEVRLPSGYTSTAMDATGNYWGTVDESVIQAMIYDKADDLGAAGYISYKPFLTAPDPLTPIATNTTTTTTTTTSTTTTTTLAGGSGVTVNLTPGWNLVGYSGSTTIGMSQLGNASNVATVWKWIPSKSAWAFYAPSLSPSALISFAVGKGYDVLDGINPGEGFWVNAAKSFSLQLPP